MRNKDFYQMHAFSVSHPELRPGEKWYMNDAIENREQHESVFNSLRIGDVAYDADGLPIEGLRPLFVSEEGFIAHPYMLGSEVIDEDESGEMP